MVNIFKRKRSDWMEGLLFAEELFQEGGNSGLNAFLWEVSGDFDEFANGVRDYNAFLIRRGLNELCSLGAG